MTTTHDPRWHGTVSDSAAIDTAAVILRVYGSHMRGYTVLLYFHRELCQQFTMNDGQKYFTWLIVFGVSGMSFAQCSALLALIAPHCPAIRPPSDPHVSIDWYLAFNSDGWRRQGNTVPRKLTVPTMNRI